MKRYEYNSKRFKWKVTISGIIGVAVFVVSTIELLLNPSETIWLAGFVVGLYTGWEAFVSISNPSVVLIDQDTITFGAYKRSHTFKIEDIKNFKVKEFTMAKKVFIRINNPGFFKGRYWVNCYYFNDTDELFNYFSHLETLIEPDGMKAYTRNYKKEKQKCN